MYIFTYQQRLYFIYRGEGENCVVPKLGFGYDIFTVRCEYFSDMGPFFCVLHDLRDKRYIFKKIPYKKKGFVRKNGLLLMDGMV